MPGASWTAVVGPAVRRADERDRLTGAAAGFFAAWAAAFSFGSASANDLLHVRQGHAVLRPGRPGQARLDRRQVESSVSVYAASAAFASWNSPCSL